MHSEKIAGEPYEYENKKKIKKINNSDTSCIAKSVVAQFTFLASRLRCYFHFMNKMARISIHFLPIVSGEY